MFNFQFHPHYQNNKVIKSSSAHEGLLIEKSFKCFENPEKTCYEKFKVQPKFTAIIFDFNNSAYGEIYKTALAMWVDKPITGIGLNNFNESCVNNKKYDKFHKNFPCTSHPHNIYLQSLVEGGLIGLIFFCIFVVLIFHKVSLNKDTGVKIILYSTLLVIFWPIMSTGSFIKNWNMIFICYIIGISLASSNIKLCLNFDSKKIISYKNLIFILLTK